MPRVGTGSVVPKTLTDGTCAYELRFHARGRRESVTLHERTPCQCGCGGGWDERSARRELGNIVARVRAGVWTREAPHPRVAAQAAATTRPIPTFHEYASYWLQARTDGVLGDKPIEENTRRDYLWRLRGHLLPFFAPRRLDEIEPELCLAFKAHKVREAADLRIAIAAGADLRDHRGRQIVPLGPSSIRKLIDTLAAILDDAIEDGHIDRNPARGRRMRVRVPKPQRTFLELDELPALIDAAAAQDAPSMPAKILRSGGDTAAKVAELLSRGMTQGAIAAELGLAKATVNYHARRLGVEGPARYVGRAFVVRVLGYSGVRNSELCDLRIRHVRLHDPGGARFHVPDSKTETGIRIVEMSPDLAEPFVDHLDRMRRAGNHTGPDDERNPARSRRMRVKVPKPPRTFLEMDELVALTDAAGEQDAELARPKLPAKPAPGSTAAKVAERWLAGKRAFEIADELGLARATVTYHLRRMQAETPGYYIGRRAIVATLGGSGVRVSELCDIRIRDLRLHAASGAHFRIPDAKTEAGIRDVQVSPDLLEEIVGHVDRLRRAGQPTDPDAYLFPNRRGRRMTRQRAGAIVHEAATLASSHLAARGLAALPNISPHSLRRTYISVALLATRFDVLWVMRQVGHADSHMTVDVYAQLQQRVERQPGEEFDKLVRQARERLYGTVEETAGDDGEPEEEPRLEDLVDEWRDERDDP